jgi:CRISPR-associated protein Cas2
MRIIVIYDVNVDRVQKVHKYLKTQLHWVQNSVFEGDVLKSDKVEIENELEKIIEEDEDSVIIFNVGHPESMDKTIIGEEKNPIENVI